MRDTGRKINSMEKDWKPGQMVQATKEIMLKEKNMVKVLLHGQTEVHIMDNLTKIILKAMEYINGQTNVDMKVNG
jgi:hypothetical protein